MADNRTIRVQGIQDVQRSLKKLGQTSRQSRTAINKALRPAANKLARGIKVLIKESLIVTLIIKEKVVEHQHLKRLV